MPLTEHKSDETAMANIEATTTGSHGGSRQPVTDAETARYASDLRTLPNRGKVLHNNDSLWRRLGKNIRTCTWLIPGALFLCASMVIVAPTEPVIFYTKACYRWLRGSQPHAKAPTWHDRVQFGAFLLLVLFCFEWAICVLWRYLRPTGWGMPFWLHFPTVWLCVCLVGDYVDDE